MSNKIFQKLVLATAGTALSLAAIEASPAHAATITYDFNVDITAGTLNGNSYNGSFSYDDTAPSPALGAQPFFAVTDFDFGFAGRTYTESDLGFDTRSGGRGATSLRITGGEIVGPPVFGLIPRGGNLEQIFLQNIGFMGFPNSTSRPLFQFQATSTSSFFAYQLPGETAIPQSGRVSYSPRSTAVPEPEDTVYALVVLGFAWLLRKKIVFPKRASN